MASGFRFGIFYFELDRKIPKIPKSRGSGSEFENSDQSQFKRNFKKILGFYGFLAIGIFSGFFEKPRDFWQSIFLIRDFFSVSGFLSPGFFRDFSPSGYPGDFLSPGSGFFVGWDFPTKSKLFSLTMVTLNLILSFWMQAA